MRDEGYRFSKAWLDGLIFFVFPFASRCCPLRLHLSSHNVAWLRGQRACALNPTLYHEVFTIVSVSFSDLFLLINCLSGSFIAYSASEKWSSFAPWYLVLYTEGMYYRVVPRYEDIHRDLHRSNYAILFFESNSSVDSRLLIRKIQS